MIICFQSIARIMKLFEDISMLIDMQSEDIENIEMNINKGKNYLMRAEKTLIVIKKEHQANRKVL